MTKIRIGTLLQTALPRSRHAVSVVLCAPVMAREAIANADVADRTTSQGAARAIFGMRVRRRSTETSAPQDAKQYWDMFALRASYSF